MVIRRSIIVAAVVLVLGLLSVAAGLAAELTRVKNDISRRLMSFVAVGQFIAGAKLCSRKDLQLTAEGYECYVLKPGMLSTAAIEALISLVLTLFYYLVIASTQNLPVKQSASEIEAPSVANDSQIPPVPPQMQ
ncbi:hypothetical protein L2E82_50303 [Cichorium intybus]|nr:hypothetical protein L2E82_50303 [Cichorium intybus]